MRIGELADLAGVTTRTVRHYHHCGLLPEPARRSNGYRVYGLRDALELVRIRRLTELGLSLDEVRDVPPTTPARNCTRSSPNSTPTWPGKRTSSAGDAPAWPSC
ncbi:MerR family transcriptional regulator [Actinomadura alba]|uniref:MerR family transcriptional regulator n=1 Tax=Actinomadura alba TaxID=406431 RepID=UPI001C9C8195|nr:MerR family transcriptional regulator [Actinomadura alba]